MDPIAANDKVCVVRRSVLEMETDGVRSLGRQSLESVQPLAKVHPIFGYVVQHSRKELGSVDSRAWRWRRHGLWSDLSAMSLVRAVGQLTVATK